MSAELPMTSAEIGLCFQASGFEKESPRPDACVQLRPWIWLSNFRVEFSNSTIQIVLQQVQFTHKSKTRNP